MRSLKLILISITFLIIQNSFSQDNRIQIDDNIFLDSSISVNGYFIEPAYPQVFGYITQYKFGIPDSSKVIINVFNSSKDTVSNIYKGVLGNGYYIFIWERLDKSKADVPSGVYYILLEAELINTKGNIYNMDFRSMLKILVI